MAKLSDTMERYLREAGRISARGTAHLAWNGSSPTTKALISRGLISEIPPTGPNQGLYLEITPAGWALLAEWGIERPADAGRLTEVEALDLAYTPSGQVTCKHGRGVADTCDPCADQRATEQERRDLYETVKHSNRPIVKREDWDAYVQQPGETRAQWKERNFVRHYGTPRGEVPPVIGSALPDPFVNDKLRGALADVLGEPRGRNWSFLLDRVQQLVQTIRLDGAGPRCPGHPDAVDVAEDFYRDPDGWRAQEAGSGAGAAPYADRFPVVYKCPVCRHDFTAEDVRDLHVSRHHGGQ